MFYTYLLEYCTSQFITPASRFFVSIIHNIQISIKLCLMFQHSNKSERDLSFIGNSTQFYEQSLCLFPPGLAN